jgi:hypothetical protein
VIAITMSACFLASLFFLPLLMSMVTVGPSLLLVSGGRHDDVRG